MLLPEWEIAIEREPLTDGDSSSRPEKTNEQRLQEFQELVKHGQAGTLHGWYIILKNLIQYLMFTIIAFKDEKYSPMITSNW